MATVPLPAAAILPRVRSRIRLWQAIQFDSVIPEHAADYGELLTSSSIHEVSPISDWFATTCVPGTALLSRRGGLSAAITPSDVADPS